MTDFLAYLNSDKRPILVFDGATGTSLQDQQLNADDYGGASLEGCNENLVLTSVSSVEKVHESFLNAGCDVIETNTFGATSIVLDEYGIGNKAYEINLKAAQIARNVANKYQSAEKPRFVAGSIGPTTKLPTLGHISFDELKNSYLEQAKALIEGGIDLFIIETCQDVLQIKAALQSVNEAIGSGKRIPLMVSVTMETTGQMLIGSDISSITTILEPFNIDILGLNCATGPEEMKDHIKYLSEHSPFHISCIPNAGLPENVGGKAHYRLTPMELKFQLSHFINDLGVQLIGGCCGTRPEHIKQLSDLSKELLSSEQRLDTLSKERSIIPAASSIYESIPYVQDNSFLIVGERLNASGSKKVRELLNDEDWDGLVGIAKSQLKENAHVLDVNVDFVGRNGIEDMSMLVKRLVNNINLPLMLDSTDYEKMESGLKHAGGKCILNSTNYEDGPGRFYKVIDLAKRYGSAVVIGTIDEDGMARSADKKAEIATRAYKDATDYGLKAYELFYDPLALPISTGLEEDRKNGLETIKAIKLIKDQHPEVHLILGISNVSFGLSSSARIVLNSIFLNEAINAGLDSAIVSPSKILPLNKISEEEIKICMDLIYDRRIFENNVCTYDPLTTLTSYFDDSKTLLNKSTNNDDIKLPIEEKLKNHIIDGEKTNLHSNLDIALNKYKPLVIINEFLLDGMKVVGELFGSGQMQLPFVLQSAETMKFAVSYLEDFMDKSEVKQSKGKFIIATVKGDVHDIGKNLVDIILSNNGYEVINLGIKQEVNSIINAQKEHNADCIAMSGLLVKSTAFMKDNLKALNEEDISVPIILGGAALTPKFVNQDCASVYKGKVIYGKDAFTDLKFMDSYMKAKELNNWDNFSGFKEGAPEGITIGNYNNTNTHQKININKIKEKPIEDNSRSKDISEIDPIKPPFIGPKFLLDKDIDITKVYKFLDRNALFAGQWQMKRSKQMSASDYKDFLLKKAEPKLDYWMNKIINEKLINPSLVYGYFPCGRVGNNLKVYDKDHQSLLGDFLLPRQRSGKRFCIADFYNDLNNNQPTDYLPMQAVTMGESASEYSHKLFSQDSYSDYLFFHGLTVQLAEALAEYIHSVIRIECGFEDYEPDNIKDILDVKYRGCRYSFGYPACPEVSDSRKQLLWLNAKKINISMDESEQLHPEQSTTAIVALHPVAKYFGI
ncbi:methionine synthase [Prochlorococcus marinus]|uniref:methionine synthase n=1 Tax=Prochlorococcus marinus TaxID=1219 RepID=UPI0022B40B0A|nr:methionine synthase [Prochlorococcus marinus]